jgi:site-specific DNA-methyltransferase (adenine-specific)
MPESVKDRPHQSHEHIFLFSKNSKYKFDWAALRGCDTDKFRPSRTVWSTSVNTGLSAHAAPFPLELVRPCVLASTEAGDLVLDPFAGSGSVGVVCKELQRNFVGIELIDQYATLARARLGERKLGNGFFRRVAGSGPDQDASLVESTYEASTGG